MRRAALKSRPSAWTARVAILLAGLLLSGAPSTEKPLLPPNGDRPFSPRLMLYDAEEHAALLLIRSGDRYQVYDPGSGEKPWWLTKKPSSSSGN